MLNITGKISTIEWDHESMDSDPDQDNYYIFVKAGKNLLSYRISLKMKVVANSDTISSESININLKGFFEQEKNIKYKIKSAIYNNRGIQYLQTLGFVFCLGFAFLSVVFCMVRRQEQEYEKRRKVMVGKLLNTFVIGDIAGKAGKKGTKEENEKLNRLK